MVKLIKTVKRKDTNQIIRDKDEYKTVGYNGRYIQSVWRKSYWPFDITDEQEMKQYIRQNFGPGKYRVYKFGGNPPLEEHLPVQWIT